MTTNVGAWDHIGTRRYRRRLVIGVYCGWVLLVVAAKLWSAAGGASSFLIPLVLLANAIAWLVLFGRKTYIKREVLASDAGLDERLVQNRNRAFRLAFRIFALFVLVVWPLSLLVISVQPGHEGFVDAFLIYAAAALLATTLPTAIWAWSEPDPVGPEQLPT